MKLPLRSGCALLVIVPLHAIAADPFFPALAAGDNWAYHMEMGTAGSTPKIVLNGVEILGKNTDGQLILAKFNPKLASDKQIMDVLRTIDADVCVMDPFYGTILRRGPRCEKPPKKGEVWRDNLKFGEHTMQIQVAFKGNERVSVGAGKFDALEFECSANYLDPKGKGYTNLEIRYWYAPQVKGFVKFDAREVFKSGERFLRASLEKYPAR